MNISYFWSCTSLILSCFLRFYLCAHDIQTTKDWSYFVFAQHWPPAACLDVPHGKCSIPQGVDDWTIHGLWPTSDKGYPSFCNSSWPFNPQSIRSILQALEVKWPNIYAHTPETSFWKHEWLKHGTCATSLLEFDSQLKYFKNSLELHDEYNIYEIMRRAGITPSLDQPVLLEYVENAITSEVQSEIKLFCKSHKQYTFPVLSDIYLCLDKTVQLIDCDKLHEGFCNKSHVYYLPFNNSALDEMPILNEV